MAERRMFAKTIVDSDAFLDMPVSSQNLYFHLSMRADDDGFLNNPKRIQRMVNASDDDLRILAAKAFIILFDNGIIVIKHWRISNYLRADRYKPTVYQEEYKQLEIKENGSYTKIGTLPLGIPLGIPEENHRETQVSIGKDRKGKDSLEERPVKTVKSYSELFLNFYDLYPLKKSKDQAYKKFNSLIKEGIEYEYIIKCLKAYKDEIATKHTSIQYIKHPSTFLNCLSDYEESNPSLNSSSIPEYKRMTTTCPDCGVDLDDNRVCPKCHFEYDVSGRKII